MFFNTRLNEEQTCGRERSKNATRETRRMISVSRSEDTRDRSKKPATASRYFSKDTSRSHGMREGDYFGVFSSPPK